MQEPSRHCNNCYPRGFRPSLIKAQLESMIKVKLSADFKELSEGENTADSRFGH